MSVYNLSDAENEIMEYLWSSMEKTSFREIMTYLEENGHLWKKQTVQTFLTRLIDKGVLKAEKEGNKSFYFPTLTKEEYVSQWTKNFVNCSFNGSLKQFLCAFTGGKRLTPKEAQELRDFLEQ